MATIYHLRRPAIRTLTPLAWMLSAITALFVRRRRPPLSTDTLSAHMRRDIGLER